MKSYFDFSGKDCFEYDESDCIGQLKTPCYIIDQNKFDSISESLLKSFHNIWNGPVVAGYSIKTNSLPWIITHLKKKGYYAEVVSEQEYLLAKHLGFKDNEIIINGPVKTEALLINSLNNGAIVNLDNSNDIDILERNIHKAKKTWDVGLRYNFLLENECPNETIVGSEHSRFGFCIENGEFEQAIKRINNIPAININGLHGHNSTKSKSLNIFKAIAKKAFTIINSYNLDVQYIDIGGGFYGDKPGAPTFSEYAEAISTFFAQKNNITLIVEPGASIISSPISYLCKVINNKYVNNKCFTTLNGSIIHIDPLMHGIQFQKLFYHKRSNPITDKLFKQELCGFTCIEMDRLGNIDLPFPLLPDDMVSFKNCGSYSMTLSPLFINYFPPVYVYDGNNYKTVRHAWDENDYISKCEVDE